VHKFDVPEHERLGRDAVLTAQAQRRAGDADVPPREAGRIKRADHLETRHIDARLEGDLDLECSIAVQQRVPSPV
jgi:hypothetical protein